jgi:hypothetical protein
MKRVVVDHCGGPEVLRVVEELISRDFESWELP